LATINGTAGNDNLTGDDADAHGDGGDDTIHGGAGDDRLDGLGGVNRLFGEDGNDTIVFGNSSHAYTYADGGAGSDILELTGNHWFRLGVDPSSSIDVKEYDFAKSAFLDMGTASNIEAINIKSDNSAIEIQEYSGPLTVNAYGFFDAVSTGSADDIINIEGYDGFVGYYGGNDRISFQGDSGNFAILKISPGLHDVSVSAANLYSLFLGHGATYNADTFVDLQSRTAIVGDTTFHLPAIHNINASTPNMALTILGSDTGDQIQLGSSDPPGNSPFVIDCRAANDTIAVSGDGLISGGRGDDSILSGGGNEWINGDGSKNDSAANPSSISGGNDTIVTHSGNDHIYGNAQFIVPGTHDGADSIFAGRGSDYVNGNAGDDHIEGGGGSDRLYGGAGNDEIFGDDAEVPDGPPGNDRINGNKGNDTIWGNGGNDSLNGGQDDDQLHGGDGNDSVSGDLGNDTVSGGPGHDTLIGGLGRDTFSLADTSVDANYSTIGEDAGQVDVIIDFSTNRNSILGGSEDMIHLCFLPDTIWTGAGSTFGDAVATAQQLVTGHAGSHEVAAIQVGADTYLFFSASGEDAVDSAVKLVGVSSSSIAKDVFA